MTYDDLYQALRDWTENPGGEFEAEIPRMIEFAEKRIYRDADLKITHREQDFAIEAGASSLAKPDGSFVVRWLRYTPVGNDPSVALNKQDPSFVAEFAEGGRSYGTPRMFAEATEALLTFAPPAPTIGTMTVADTYHPPGLSSSNPTTWLSLNAPEVLQYAALLEAAIFLKQQGNAQSPGMLQSYRERYMEAIATLRAEEERKSTNMTRLGEGG